MPFRLGTCQVLVPISFVFEHMGTLNEIDREYAELAASVGITSFARVPTLRLIPNPECILRIGEARSGF